MGKMKQAQKIDFGSEGVKRNFGRRGEHKTFCDECGEECLVYQAYTRGRPVLCKKCREEKDKRMFKEY